jgi:NhaP-type Na+/H+ or K+/H+ antiporter
MLLESATSVGGFASVGRGYLVFVVLIFCLVGLLLAAIIYLILIFVKERPIRKNPEKLKIYTSLSVFLLYLVALSWFLGGGMDAFKVTIFILVLSGLWLLGKYIINKIRNRK